MPPASTKRLSPSLIATLMETAPAVPPTTVCGHVPTSPAVVVVLCAVTGMVQVHTGEVPKTSAVAGLPAIVVSCVSSGTPEATPYSASAKAPRYSVMSNHAPSGPLASSSSSPPWGYDVPWLTP
jgi:hypothetical protein